MRITLKDDLTCAWIPSHLPGAGLVMVAICKLTLRLTPNGTCTPHDEAMLISGDLVGDAPVYPSDFVPYKPRGDVLVHGKAHAPAGKAVRYLPVEIGIGDRKKQLLAIGNRQWKRGLLGFSAGEPEPFVTMPLGWNQAFGGLGDKVNPVGCGRDGARMPNVEWPDQLLRSPGDRVQAAGFGPTSADWEPRRSMVGTYGGDYVTKHWPWLPPDFDFGHFNAAPADQQIEGFLHGNEALSFVNLHRDYAQLSTRLPSLRTRMFITLESGEFREVQQRLDTLWCDLENDRLVLVWRGHTPVRTPLMREVVHVLAALERLGEPKDVEHYRAMRDGNPAVQVKPPPDAAAATAAAAHAAALEAKEAAMEAELAKAEAQLAAEEQNERSALLESGIDPTMLAKDPPAHGIAAHLAQLKQAKVVPPEILKLQPAAAESETSPEDIADFEKMEAELEQAKLEARSTQGWTRESLLVAVAAGTELAFEDLTGLDLSGCALAGARLEQVVLAGCNLGHADLKGASLRGSVLAGANLQQADLTAAVLDRADCTGASFTGARLAGASLSGTVLEGQKLAGMDLSGCRGQGAHFAGADLSGCKLTGADFSKGNFTECMLVGADCTGAVLRDARLHSVDASNANFQNADLTGMRGDDGARFAGADFRHAILDGVVLEFANLHGADLRYASLRRGLLTGSDLGQCDLSRADLERTSLADANLTGARLLQTNLRYACLERCDLKGADARHANLYGAGLWETKTELADLREANLRSTLRTLR